MNFILPDSFIILLISLGLILLLLYGIISWIIPLSFRMSKVEFPKFKTPFAIAFLQILLGVMTVLIIRAIKNNLLIVIGTGLGITILSGLLLKKSIIKKVWKQTLRVWTISVAMQLVLVPIR